MWRFCPVSPKVSYLPRSEYTPVVRLVVGFFLTLSFRLGTLLRGPISFACTCTFAWSSMANEMIPYGAQARESIETQAGAWPCATTNLQAILELPPYKLATLLELESRLPDGGRIPEILDTLASHSPTRAALALADLCGLRIHQGPQDDRRAVAIELFRLLERCQSLAEIRDAMQTIPTLDAITCRRELFKIGGFAALDATGAAMYAVMTPDSLPIQLERAGRHLTRDPSTKDQALHKRFSLTSKETCEPLTAHPQLSPAHQALLGQFREEIAPTLFPPEKYGYGALSDMLECLPLQGDVWGIRNPWGESPDLPSTHCHQCADSAPAARSFFVSRGIPADVYVINLGNVCHNVCVVFFEERRAEGLRHVPVLVDESPYGGFYSIEEGERDISVYFDDALGIQSVIKQRASPLAFVGGDRLHIPNAGLAPWCCEELPSGRGRVIGFGGVMASQKSGSWVAERGTPEYYGNGIRVPRPELSLYVLPHRGNELEALRSFSGPFVAIAFYQDSGRAVPYDWNQSSPQDKEISRLSTELVAEIEPLATRHLADIHAMVQRSGYSLTERVFGKMGTLHTLT